MNSRKTFARVGALVAGTAAALSLGSTPVSADSAKARIDGSTNGYVVNLDSESQTTTLFNLSLEGGNSLRAYCVEISVRVDPSRPLYESPWDEFPNPDSPFHGNRDHINWVLHHGYPAQSLSDLEQTLTEQGVELHNGLSQREAITATQAAVWHYSDGKNIDRQDPVRAGQDVDADVLALYDYLTGESNVGMAEPNAALELDPNSATGVAGERIGPFTVSTTGEITELISELPEGVTVTDAEGNELTAEDIAEDYDRKPAQSLILASSDDTTMKAKASAEWKAAPKTTPPEETTEVPTPTPTSQQPPVETPQPSETPQTETEDLAQTGVSAMTPLLIGLGLVAAGTAAILLQRRRKNA